jgi:hypothetical protein
MALTPLAVKMLLQIRDGAIALLPNGFCDQGI